MSARRGTELCVKKKHSAFFAFAIFVHFKLTSFRCCLFAQRVTSIYWTPELLLYITDVSQLQQWNDQKKSPSKATTQLASDSSQVVTMTHMRKKKNRKKRTGGGKKTQKDTRGKQNFTPPSAEGGDDDDQKNAVTSGSSRKMPKATTTTRNAVLRFPSKFVSLDLLRFEDVFRMNR